MPERGADRPSTSEPILLLPHIFRPADFPADRLLFSNDSVILSYDYDSSGLRRIGGDLGVGPS